MKKILLPVFVLVIIISLSTFVCGLEDKITPSDAAIVNSSYVFPYMPNSIYKIYCRADRLVDIQLQPGEEYIDTNGADTVRWDLNEVSSGIGASKQWHINIKPKMDKDITTNLILYTDRHVYHIEVYVNATLYTPIICWTYPREENAALKRLQQLKEDEEANNTQMNVSMEKVNFEYRIKGKYLADKPKYSWAPLMVCDDGLKTYIKMPETMGAGDAPVLFVKDDGKLVLINYRVKKSYYILDRLFTQAEMRSGKEVIVIENLKK